MSADRLDSPDLPQNGFLLALLQLADSALPVGSLSHSFGLETLAFDEDIENLAGNCPASVRSYLEESLSESLLVDGVFCREAHDRGRSQAELKDLNEQLSALRLARESREASLLMGRRFAALASALNPMPVILELTGLEELHYAVAFGYTLGAIGADAGLTVAAFLHQSVLHTISAAQRLLPLGQIHAAQIAWDLKPRIEETASRTKQIEWRNAGCFSHLPELASMRHCALPSRLFIS